MSNSLMFTVDLVAILVMVFGLYFPRHRRKDLVVSFLGVNVGVLAVANALSSAGVNAGLGLGLFGVLSIIRLRSTELDQEEVAYYFAALAMGLLGGLTVEPQWLTPTLMACILAVLFIGDHPRLFAGYRSQVMTLDRAFTNETELHHHLEKTLGGKVHRLKVRKVDLVNDTTILEVRYEVDSSAPAPQGPEHATTEPAFS